MARQIGHCDKHRLAIYETDDGTVVHTCAHCAPPSKDPSNKRLIGYARTYHDEYCTDDTLELLKMTPLRLSFQVPPWAEDEFFNDYLDCSGDRIDFDTVGVSHNNAKSYQDKRWYSALVEFEWDDDLVFSDKYADRIKPSDKEGWVKIYCIHLAGFLLANGLHAGPNNC